MNKSKNLEIKGCYECTFHDKKHHKNTCFNQNIKIKVYQGREIDDIFSFPEWCPLDDVMEVNNC